MGISVIGLGAMGSALAKSLLASGSDVTVWNRSEAKSRNFKGLGANVAPTLNEAIAANAKAFVCIESYDAAIEIFSDEQVAQALNGRSILQLSGGTPQDVRKFANLMHLHGAAYLDGAIMVYPGDIGTERAQILFSVQGPFSMTLGPIWNSLPPIFVMSGVKSPQRQFWMSLCSPDCSA